MSKRNRRGRGSSQKAERQPLVLSNEQESAVLRLGRGSGSISDEEVETLSRLFPHGMRMEVILRVVQSRGRPLNEPSFRKYIQVGLLPNCNRIGDRGKHRGSFGVWPIFTINRICEIRDYLEMGANLEHLQIPSFRGVVSVFNIAEVAKALLAEMDQQTTCEQEEGVKIPRTILRLRAEVKQALRAVVRSTERAAIPLAKLSSATIAEKQKENGS